MFAAMYFLLIPPAFFKVLPYAPWWDLSMEGTGTDMGRGRRRERTYQRILEIPWMGPRRPRPAEPGRPSTRVRAGTAQMSE